ncbi:MAG TPA: acyl-CoA dehydrogenase family protein [Euzebya sp.]|nr:acyl-CoA dehydrogenase family protein [Euzebya sp.]
MDAVLTEEQAALAEAAADLAADGLAAARTVLDGGAMPAQPTQALFEGFNGLGIDEAAGGAGGSLVDLALVVRALGRTVCPTPWLPHQLALHAASAAGLDISDGMRPDARWVIIDGDPTNVRHGVGAELAVLLDDDDVEVRPVGETQPHQVMDRTRPMAEVTMGPLLQQSRAGGNEGRMRARAVVAASLVGTGLGAIERASAYAMQREQFGRPVGSFQGVSHQLAEAWTAVELAWSLALYACWAVSEGQGDANRAVDAAVAKAGSAAIAAAERGMQVHGGVGITWEADPHLALRRAMADDAWFGGVRKAQLSLGRSLLAG